MKKILLALIFAQLAWITFLPIFQTPDEQAHFGQVAVVAETGSNFIATKNLNKEIYFAEEILGTIRQNNGDNKYTYHPEFNIEYSNNLYGFQEKEIISFPKSFRTDYLINEATAYPPLYYRLGSFFNNGNLFDRVFAVRLMTGVTGIITFVVVYLIGKVLYKDPLKQISLALLTSFAPMFMFVNSGVTSDSLFNLIFPAFLLLCLLLIKNGLNLKGLLAVGAIFILGIYTKPQANIMAFIFVPLLLFLFFKSKKKVLFLPFVILGTILVFGEVIRRILGGISIFPESSSVKFSPGAIIEHFQFTLRHTYREVLPWYWGVFRWLSLGLPSLLRQITNLITILSFGSFIVYLFRIKKFTEEFWLKSFMFFTLITYFLAITAFDFGFRQSHGFSFGIQGRYFFPVAVVVSMIIIDGMGFLFARITKGFYIIFLDFGMILFNVFTFFYLMFTYYEISFPGFFVQASQYKPLWLKYPVNLIILVGYLICSLLLLLFIMRKKLLKVL